MDRKRSILASSATLALTQRPAPSPTSRQSSPSCQKPNPKISSELGSTTQKSPLPLTSQAIAFPNRFPPDSTRRRATPNHNPLPTRHMHRLKVLKPIDFPTSSFAPTQLFRPSPSNQRALTTRFLCASVSLRSSLFSPPTGCAPVAHIPKTCIPTAQPLLYVLCRKFFRQAGRDLIGEK
jgi:hypothetical protein